VAIIYHGFRRVLIVLPKIILPSPHRLNADGGESPACTPVEIVVP
jgi:hypothetical protein